MAKTALKSFSLSNSSQKPLFFAVFMYLLYGQPRYFKFKWKYQQYDLCFSTIFPFKYINLGNQLHYKKYNQKFHHVQYYDGKWKHKFCYYFDPFPEIMFTALKTKKNSIKNILMLWTWSQESDRNISKTCVFIFHHRIQHDEDSGCTFYLSISFDYGFKKKYDVTIDPMF